MLQLRMLLAALLVVAVQQAESAKYSEAAVYTALLKDASLPSYRTELHVPTYIAVGIKTMAWYAEDPRARDGWVERLLKDLPSLERSTLDSFVEVHQDSCKLTGEVAGDLPIRLVPAEFCDEWERGDLYFWDYYPDSDGLRRLSRVGFSQDGEQALVYYEYDAGGWYGAGVLVLLQLEKGEWKGVGRYRIWIV